MRRTYYALGMVGLTAVGINCWAGALDGTRAVVKVVRADASTDEEKKGFDDTLSFVGGTFTSSAFLAKGFQPARYNGEQEEREAEFMVEQTNGAGEVIDWLGNIQGNHVGGRLHWMTKDGTKRTSYHFNGTKEPNAGSTTNSAAASAPQK